MQKIGMNFVKRMQTLDVQNNILQSCFSTGYNPSAVKDVTDATKKVYLRFEKTKADAAISTEEFFKIVDATRQEEIQWEQETMEDYKKKFRGMAEICCNTLATIKKTIVPLKLDDLLKGMKQMIVTACPQKAGILETDSISSFEEVVVDLQSMLAQDKDALSSKAKINSEELRSFYFSIQRYISFVEKHIHGMLKEQAKLIPADLNLWTTHSVPELGISFKLPPNWTYSIPFSGVTEKLVFSMPNIGSSSRVPSFDIVNQVFNAIPNLQTYANAYLEDLLSLTSYDIRFISQEMIPYKMMNASRHMYVVEVVTYAQNPIHGYFAFANENNRLYCFIYTEFISRYSFVETLFDRQFISNFLQQVSFFKASTSEHKFLIKTESGLVVKLPNTPLNNRMRVTSSNMQQGISITASLPTSQSDFAVQLNCTWQSAKNAVTTPQNNGIVIEKLDMKVVPQFVEERSSKTFAAHASFVFNNLEFLVQMKAAPEYPENWRDMFVEVLQNLSFGTHPSYFDQVVHRQPIKPYSQFYHNEQYGFDIGMCN